MCWRARLRSRAADQSIPGRQRGPAGRRGASPFHRAGDVGRRQRHANTQHGGGGLASAAAGRAQRRYRDGGGGRLRAARRSVRLRRARKISPAAAEEKETEKEAPQVRRERGCRVTLFESSERLGGEGPAQTHQKGAAPERPANTSSLG